jgi:hypothetical protein
MTAFVRTTISAECFSGEEPVRIKRQNQVEALPSFNDGILAGRAAS